MIRPSVPRTIRALLEHRALVRPAAVYAPAVHAEPTASSEAPAQLSFAELASSCRQTATLLLSHGLHPGDTVSLVMPNGLNTLRLLAGALDGGWCVNPVNLLSSATQRAYVPGVWKRPVPRFRSGPWSQ